MTEREEYKAARRAAQQAFLEAGYASCKLYTAMEEEDVVDEYRRAGKLHTYDPDKEVQKRFAKVAKLYPYPWPKKMVAMIEQYMKFLEEDEDDYRIGLYSFLEQELDC
uniref:Uncharacterized protein n=1 Tax=Avena sativa TaxID=4498 RepID=A0ACD5VNC4_AVESA